MHDPVKSPDHYFAIPATCSQCGHPIECIDVVKHMNFPLGAATKYIWRVDAKDDPIENLKKAIQFLEFEIAKREKSE